MEIFSDNRLAFVFRHPFCLSIYGPSQSGKTHLLLSLIERRTEVMSTDFEKIIYVYTENQPLFDQYKERHSDVTFTKNMELVKQVTGQERTLIVFDDKLLDFVGKENQEITDWFIRGSHHKNCSIVLLMQNAFAKNMRTVALNSIYVIYMNSPRDKSTISNLGRQIFPGKKNYMMDAYEDAVSKPYGYLLFDFHQLTNNKFRVRNSIFPSNNCKIYVPEEDAMNEKLQKFE